MNPQHPASPTPLREAIAAHCRMGSWFALRPLLHMQASEGAGPELVADLLASAGARSRFEADRLQRLLSHRFWSASATSINGARPSITLHSGAGRWTLRLLRSPQLHIETIGR